jgi:hypothetical protein
LQLQLLNNVVLKEYHQQMFDSQLHLQNNDGSRIMEQVEMIHSYKNQLAEQKLSLVEAAQPEKSENHATPPSTRRSCYANI